jgi:hypothetical protein
VNDNYAPTKGANKVADWIELTALRTPGSTGGAALQDIGAKHGYREVDISLGVNTIKRRAALLGDHYPFRTAGGGVAAKQGADQYVWTALLLMSAESPVRSLRFAEAVEHLERITAAALANLYGPGTQALRFGWPSENGRPLEFPEAVRWLAGRMGVPIGSAYRPPFRKDGGVDVVVWRPFPDGRSGFPVLLAQCTLEREYAHKASDIDLRVWSGWLALDADPATALAIADVVAPGEEWNALAARTIVLDRIRLATLASEGTSDPSLQQVREWARDAISALKALE